MLVVVTYDVADDKRRGRLHNLLKNYGDAVQYSVFECFLDAKELSELKMKARTHIKKEDSIVYYCLCKNCCNKVTGIRNSDLPKKKHTIII